MTIELSPEEITVITCALKDHREYYGTLAGNPQASAKTLAMHTLLVALFAKLKA